MKKQTDATTLYRALDGIGEDLLARSEEASAKAADSGVPKEASVTDAPDLKIDRLGAQEQAFLNRRKSARARITAFVSLAAAACIAASALYIYPRLKGASSTQSLQVADSTAFESAAEVFEEAAEASAEYAEEATEETAGFYEDAEKDAVPAEGADSGEPLQTSATQPENGYARGADETAGVTEESAEAEVYGEGDEMAQEELPLGVASALEALLLSLLQLLGD